MRIHPIREMHEALIHPLHEDRGEIACRPCWAVCPPFPCKRERRYCRSGEFNINQVLLRRAIAGVLTRLRSFDWQQIHGHHVGESGRSLDVFV